MRVDRIAERLQPTSVHPSSSPIITSKTLGVKSLPTESLNLRHPACFIMDGASWLLVAVGVANQPETLSLMGRSGISSSQNQAFDRVTCFLQFCLHPVEASRLEAINVLKYNPSWPRLFDDPEPFPEKPASFAFDATGKRVCGCAADVLAGEPCGKQINPSNSGCVKRSDVAMYRHSLKPLGQHPLTELVVFHELDRFEPRPLSGYGFSANS
jgi:hypothetical protein